MSSAPDKSPTAACASLSVRSSVCSVIVCGVLLGGAVSEAIAGPGGPGGGAGGPGGGGPGGGGNFGGGNAGNFNGASGEAFNQGTPRRDDAARMAAQSAQRDGQREVQREAQRYDARAPKSGETRQVDPRSFEGRAEEQRRALDQNREGYRRTHLTPDERRDLRRQINEAGPEIYSNSPHH